MQRRIKFSTFIHYPFVDINSKNYRFKLLFLCISMLFLSIATYMSAITSIWRYVQCVSESSLLCCVFLFSSLLSQLNFIFFFFSFVCLFCAICILYFFSVWLSKVHKLKWIELHSIPLIYKVNEGKLTN